MMVCCAWRVLQKRGGEAGSRRTCKAAGCGSMRERVAGGWCTEAAHVQAVHDGEVRFGRGEGAGSRSNGTPAPLGGFRRYVRMRWYCRW